MTIPEYNKKMDKVIKDAERNEALMVKLGAFALTAIKERVIETGVNAKGQKFKPYSTKPLSVSCKNVKRSVCKEGKKSRYFPGGYKQFREAIGARTDIVNFSVNNDMWSDINIISKSSDHQKGTVIIGAKQESEKKKLSGNTKRRGDILDLNPHEVEDLYKRCNLNMLQIFRNNGL